MSESLLSVGTIGGAAETLRVTIDRAVVTVRHEERADIAVSANRPDHWSVDGSGAVRQTQTQPPEDGIYISGAHISMFHGGRGHNNVVMMDDNRVILENDGKRTVIQTQGRNVSVIDGEVFVDGKKVDPEAGQPAPEPGPANTEPAIKGPDRLEILVPFGFLGALSLIIDDGSADIDRWSGTTVLLSTIGDGQVSIGDIVETKQCMFKSSGDGNIELKRVGATIVSVEFTDDGSLKADSVTAQTFSSLQRGDGGIEIGSVEATATVDCQVRDDGSFRAESVRTKRFTSVQTADGEINLGVLEAPESVECRLSDDGSFNASSVKTAQFLSVQSADGAVVIDELEAQSAVECRIGDDGGITVKKLNAGSFTLNNSGDGEVEIDSLQVTGAVDLLLNDDGAVTLGQVKANAFSSTHRSDGGLEIDELVTESLRLENGGDANIRISGGSATSGSALNRGDGDIRLSGSFSALQTRNTGDGKIKIR